MIIKILVACFVLFIAGCSYLEAQPERTWFEYEESTSMCAKILEYPDRIVILYTDCSKAPETIKRVKHFGEGVEE